MSLPNVIFTKGQGGLGRPLAGKDHYSGMVIYTANGNLPSGFLTTAREKVVYSLAEAVAAGILNDHADGTGAVGVVTFTVVGANGDTVEVKIADIDANGVPRTTSLGVFKKTASETTVTLLAAAYKAVVNAGTLTHGYTADNTAGALSVTAPKRLGKYLNAATKLSVAVSGTLAAAVTTDFAGGASSLKAIWYYHVSEFFRMQPKGVLYIGFYAIPGTYDYTEIVTLQTFAKGQIRQVGILKDPGTAYAQGDLTLIDLVCKTQDTLKKNLSAVYAADLTGTAAIGSMADLNTLSAYKCSASIGQDGAGYGNYLFLISGKSVTHMGVLLGTIAVAKVSENIGWVGKFNISNGYENEVLAFANGQKYTDATISESTLDALNDKRYIFLTKITDVSGSFWNDSHTACSVSSDYAYIENNRTIDKAIRNVNTSMVYYLKSPLKVNSDGTLSDQTVLNFENVGDVALNQMLRDDELSDRRTTVNPAQLVLTTSNLEVVLDLIAQGVARTITIPIGFKPKLI